MRFSLARIGAALVGCVAIFLLWIGFRLDGLPFSRLLETSDAAISHYPAALYLRQSVLERGEFPVWNLLLMGGTPFAANPLNKTAYPLQWLVLVLPPLLHINVMIVLHGILGAVGMWRWSGTFRLHTEGRMLATLAYGFSPRLIAIIGAGHLDIVYAMAWLPFVMWAVERLLHQTHQLPRATLRLALFVALMFLADMRVSLFGGVVASVYAVSLGWRTPQRLAWGSLALIPIALMTLSVFVPLVLWQPYLNRASLTLSEAGAFSLDISSLLGIFVPPAKGDVESFIYLGLGIVGFAVYGLIRQPRTLALWGIIVAFGIAYALGINGGLWTSLVNSAPILLWFRVPARAWLVVVLVLPIMAAHGFQHALEGVKATYGEPLPKSEDTPRSLVFSRLLAAGVFPFALLCGLFSWTVPTLSQSAALSVLVFGFAYGIVILLILYRRLTPQIFAIAILCIACADACWAGRARTEWRGVDQWLTVYQPLVERLRADNVGRIYSPDYSLPQQVAAHENLALLGGVDPFQIRGSVNAIQKAGGIEIDGYQVVVPPLAETSDENPDQTLNQDTLINTGLMAEWGVTHILAAYPIDNPQLTLRAMLNGVYIYANQDSTPANLSTLTGWPRDLVVDVPNEVEVGRLNQWTLIVSGISGVSFILLFFVYLYLKWDSRHV